MAAPTLIVPANRKRNLLWPMSRKGKGYSTGIMVPRYEAAIQHFLRTPRGSYKWAPSYGTLYEMYRGQSLPIEDLELLRSDTASHMALWIPDVTLLDITHEAPPNEEWLIVGIVWGIPLGGQAAGERRMAYGPQTTSVTY